MGRRLIQRHIWLQSLLSALFLLDTMSTGWSPSIRYSSPVQLTPHILFHLPNSSWPYRSAICTCTLSTYSHISCMIALRKQIGQYTNDLVSMHTNVSTILTRLCGLKVPLRQSFAQRFVWSVYTTMGACHCPIWSHYLLTGLNIDRRVSSANKFTVLYYRITLGFPPQFSTKMYP